MFCIILFENKYMILPSKRQSIAEHRVLHRYVGCLNCPGSMTLLCLSHGNPLQPPGSHYPWKGVWSGADSFTLSWGGALGPLSRVRQEAPRQVGQVDCLCRQKSGTMCLWTSHLSFCQCFTIFEGISRNNVASATYRSAAWSLARWHSLK